MKDVVLLKKYEENLKKGEWKCPDSPTGAHLWIEHKERKLWKCYWCRKIKPGVNPWTKKRIKSLLEEEIKTIGQDLNVQEAAEELGISRAMVYKLISDKKLSARMRRIGFQKMWTINRKEIERAKKEIDIEKEKEEFRAKDRRRASI